MKNEEYRLVKPMLGFAKGEQFTRSDWAIWTRKRTGEDFHYRSDIGTGEIAMVLDYMREAKTTTILEKL